MMADKNRQALILKSVQLLPLLPMETWIQQVRADGTDPPRFSGGKHPEIIRYPWNPWRSCT